MYDYLEGLDYKPGECSYYVSQVLSDVKASLENGDMRKIPSVNIKIGDVVVGGFSSHLVVDEDYCPRMTISGKKDAVLEQESLVLVIPDETLRRKQEEHKQRNGRTI